MNREHAARFAVIIAAAGKSSRFGNETTVKKPFASLAGKAVWLHSAERFFQRDDVVQLIVVVSPDDLLWFREYYAEEIDRLLIVVVEGGKERVDSIRLALLAISDDADFVAVHDAARPCTTDKEIDAVFEAAELHGAAMLATPVVGTVKRVRENKIVETVSRTDLWEAQTPQVFKRQLLKDAYQIPGDSIPTDDAELVEKTNFDVWIVPADRWNLKITTQTDLRLAEIILSAKNTQDR